LVSLVGILITIAALLGGFAAMGGHLAVLMQPWEFVIIVGTAVGTFIVANPWKVIVDTGLAMVQALTGAVPSERYYLDLLGALHALDARVAGQGPQRGGSAHRRSVLLEIFRHFPACLRTRRCCISSATMCA
jgi:chemotaxis protein MotA